MRLDLNEIFDGKKGGRIKAIPPMYTYYYKQVGV